MCGFDLGVQEEPILLFVSLHISTGILYYDDNLPKGTYVCSSLIPHGFHRQ